MDTEPRRLGKYELQVSLARGGQGEVWKAFDPQLRRNVAIKQLHANLQSDPDFIARFQLEARFIASLHHPNIVQIHDFQFIQTPGSNMTTAYMVMDYIEGPTLADYIRNTSRKGLYPTATDIVYIFTAVSLAIDYAHEKGMIHRDIKPANIILDKRSLRAASIGRPILTDFGIAKLQGAFAETTKVLGTPLYSSPEQAQGLSGDKRSDLYSLGIILYEMTTGVTPFRGSSPMAILMQHYQEVPTPPDLINPAIPPALSEVILKSIAKDPDARFQSASAMTIALAEALNVPVPVELRKTASSYPTQTSPVPGTTSLPSPPVIPKQPIRQKKSLYIALIALLIALVVCSSVLYALFGPKAPPTATTPNPVVGHVLFLSSQTPAGNLDEVQITLPGIHNAPAGKTYYAWLDYYDDSILPIHWSLTVQNGSLSPSSYTDPQHRSLPALINRFLITLETTQQGQTIVLPAGDRSYYASITPAKPSVQRESFDIKQCPQSSSNNPCIP